MIADARFVAPDTQFACDICIVGGGPAGIAIAHRLRDSGLTVLLLESGGFDPELASQALFRGDITGRPYYRLDACRFRLLGGSTNRWGGWCRPLEAVDFERRSWLPWSGWPITAQTLEPYYPDTAKLFELADSRFDAAVWRSRLPAPLALDGSNFESVVFHYSPETNFGQAYRDALSRSANLTLIIHANLTRMELEPGTARVARLRVAALGRQPFTVQSKAVVLAAGGIENARLLLASNAERTSGLGNEHDLVGRFFMEHLHVPAGHLLAAPGAGRSFYRKAMYGGIKIRGVITPTAAAQAQHHLPATSIAIEPASYSYGTPFIGWAPSLTFSAVRAYRRFRSSRLGVVAEGVKSGSERLSGIPRRIQTWNAARAAGATPALGPGRMYSLYFRSEQIPNRASRVLLSKERDAFGVPQSSLDWRIEPADLAAVTGWLKVFGRDIAERGLGTVIAAADDWQRHIIGGPHHMGTTRMSADPRTGVVDEDCRVHSLDNVYIAGSSVFSTGGYANPTFTLVALALRLADRLRERLQSRVSVESSP